MSIDKTFSRTSESTKKTSKSLISDKCIELLNFRINEEEKSYRIYENMSMWLTNNGYPNAGKLWKKYANEELIHVSWAKDYLIGLGIQPELRSMPTLKNSYSFTGIIELSLQHEVLITEQCSAMAKESMQDGDFMLHELSLKYLKEQHEEVARQQDWVDQLEAFGSSKEALRLLDNAMGE